MSSRNWTYDGLACRRRPTRTVNVGDVAVGSEHPIRVQSMTTPATTDTAATVRQIERLVQAGCEIVRLTVPRSTDADNLPNIRRELKQRGIRVPLVADIHFTPAAAMRAIEHVEKIRVNPGNYADKKKFAVREYTDREYDVELERIHDVFSPLVLRARQLGVSMRIGTNHGSLSDRIMNRHGDSPEGMVESALEFVRICEHHDYRELILSMKASNPVVVLQAYRLLVQRMAEQNMDYPVHLGVTEAGDGEDGRTKSAVGIGSLLDDGIGDTVRVSLTEDPVAEIPVARALVAPYNRRHEAGEVPSYSLKTPVTERRDPFTYSRRTSHEVRVGPHTIGAAHPVLVEVPLHGTLDDEGGLRAQIDAQAGLGVPQEARAEIVSVAVEAPAAFAPLDRLHRSLQLVAPRLALSARLRSGLLLDGDDERLRRLLAATDRVHLLLDAADLAGATRLVRRLLEAGANGRTALVVEAGAAGGTMEQAVELALEVALLETASGPRRVMLALTPSPAYSPQHALRLLAARLADHGQQPPLLLFDDPAARGADPLLGPASCLGGLLCDGLGDSIQLAAGTASDSRRLAFGILQAARVRITRTEFISCPSCGRTLFDLEETTARIKASTAHLKGVKIAIMGCVVNGPGEMADADFGYVGWGDEKIALFVGKEMVAKDIPTGEADHRLVELIKKHGRWVDPP